MTGPRITALLVVHDGVTWLPEVVASIASQTLSADQILAIDTGSIDASAKLLKGARIPTVTLNRTTSFGNAVAYGLSQLPPAIAGVEEWLWILHDDCALNPSALEELVAAVADRPNIVMAGPKLLGWHDRTHLLEVGISIATNGSRWTGLEPNEYDQGQRDGIHEVLAVSTAGALIRRDVFEELGGFDANLELFRDDVDFGWRLHAAGHSAIVVPTAVGYHAQAAATERRAIDIEGAPLHRPLLLDRRNAAYVLLANSSWWKLPLLALQLLGGSVVRSVAFLFAKLPGYAADEILAIATLIVKPGELIAARRVRRTQRLVTSGIVTRFIPSRWTQVRSGASRAIENLRLRIFPDQEELAPISSDFDVVEDEEILQPLAHNSWKKVLSRPLVIAYLALTVLSFGWARHRFGAIAGGALADSPHGVRDLFNFYSESWHLLGMGSNGEAPSWVLLVGLASALTFGNVALLISLFFIAAPFLALWSSHALLKRHTSSSVLSATGALLYALSPVAISSVDAGRLGVLVLIIALPLAFTLYGQWDLIEERSIRNIYGISLLLWVLACFNPILYGLVLAWSAFYIYQDFQASSRNWRDSLFLARLTRRAIVPTTLTFLLAPISFQYFVHPTRLLLEIGLLEGGGGSHLALLANPGGEGSLPWWVISPITFLLIVTFFSITKARLYSLTGIVFLLVATVLSSLQVKGNGSTSSDLVSSASMLAVATLLASLAAVVMFDDIRSRLESAHINYQHFAVALILLITVTYSATSSLWIFSAGANSPLQRSNGEVLPAYLTVEEDVKTLVVRPITQDNHTALAYFIARGDSAKLGEADVAADTSAFITSAVEGLIDNTGVGSSKVFAAFGIKYVFVKNPASQELIQTIDGLGGFTRASATDVGTVWKVAQPTGRVIFTDFNGTVTILSEALGAVTAPGPGTITLTENYSRSWQALAQGVRLEKSKSEYGLPQFKVTEGGEVVFLHDGTYRRAWISIFAITLVTCIVMALPAGRRRREMSDKELA
jgi:GT2 family glycosyltransferase